MIDGDPQAPYTARSRRAGLPEGTQLQDLGSPPELMAAVLAGVRQRHGGAAGYLMDHGLPETDLDLLRTRLFDRAGFTAGSGGVRA